MTELSIQLIMNSRFRTSALADRQTKELMEGLGLSTKASVARLAIGRSLSMGVFSNEEGLDARGLEIPASSLFTQDDVPIWIGLIVSHALVHNGEKIDSMELFRTAVRKHWHRGTSLLIEDWQDCDKNFDKFLMTLINRRTELIDGHLKKIAEDQEPVVEVEKPKDISQQLIKALSDIGVASAEVKDLVHGPRVTRYKIFLRDVNQLDKLRKGIERLSLTLSIHKTMPSLIHGDEPKTVFLDIPRPKPAWKHISFDKLREWISTLEYKPDQLIVFPGVDVMGNPYPINLVEAPHLLVGGATGQGKSVCLHALILSLIMTQRPSALKLSLIDPKQVEFSVYRGIKFLYANEVATGVTAARERIFDLIEEMDNRYKTFKDANVTNIFEAHNAGIAIPNIVVFIDEFADLVIRDRDLENHIIRLAQMARAAGIHLVLATQRPDAQTFSGLIRSNIPSRIALTVQKSSESKIILDETGAENLLGAGDMLIRNTW